MYVYLMYYCITAVECDSSSATAVHYTTHYYYTAAVFAVCTHTSLAGRRSLATAFVGYTRLYTAAVSGSINTVRYLWLLFVLIPRYALRCTYDIPLPARYVLLSCSPAVARPPPRSCWLYTAVDSSTFCWYTSSSTTPEWDS